MLSGRIISIVDDDTSIREGLSSLLRSQGAHADSFASAEDFLRSAGVIDSECLIVDVRMPRLSGLELQDELLRQGIHIPVIFISAYASPAVMNRVKSGTAVAFLEKPFDSNAIEKCLALALSGVQQVSTK